MSSLSETASYYDILGVPQDASDYDIRRRFRELVLKFHPDREGSALAREAMVLINQAYEVLSDPHRRFAYDIFTMKPSEGGLRHWWTERAVPRLARFWNQWKIPSLVAITLAISCMTGYIMEPLLEDKPVYYQIISIDRHHFLPIINELLHSLVSAIPFLGIGWGVFAGFMTGASDRAVMALLPHLSSGSFLPFLCYAILANLLTLGAYFLGMCITFWVICLIRIRSFNHLDRMVTGGLVVITMVLGALGGLAEHEMASAIHVP